jgi:hypothetical protein
MLRLATSFAAATLLALHGAPLADATTCTPVTFLGTPVFFPDSTTATDPKTISAAGMYQHE